MKKSILKTVCKKLEKICPVEAGLICSYPDGLGCCGFGTETEGPVWKCWKKALMRLKA